MSRTSAIFFGTLAIMCGISCGSTARTSLATAEAAAANPIRKVVSLLKGMQTKIAAEGEEAKTLYDKYMCYCKSAGGDLEASIAAADTKMPAVASTIKESEEKLAQAKAALTQAQTDRSDAKAAMAAATAIREKTAAAFAEEQAMYETNIAAIKKAVAALEKGVYGSFLQTTAAQAVRKIALDDQNMLDSDRQMLLSFLTNEHATSYVPSSGEVIGILKEMGDTMAKSLGAATGTETDAIKTYQALMGDKSTEVSALTDTIEAKTAQIGDLGVSIVQMKNDLTETEAALVADKDFLADMDKTCAGKTAEYEEAVKLRGEELAAISETIKVLDDDDALEIFKKTLPSSASSFVQLETSSRQMKAKALEAIEKARRASNSANRPQLDFLALAIRGKAAGFEKVIALIDTMVKTLKKEQLDDDNKKEYCEMQFDHADDKKKTLEWTISGQEKAIAAAEEGVATLKDEIAALESGIKDLDKEVAEATEQRKEESAEFTELMASDSTAKELLGFAKNRLNKFYNPKLYKAAPKRVLSAEDDVVVSMGGTLAPTAPPGGIAGTGIAFVEVSAHKQLALKAAPPPPPEAAAAYAKSSEESTGVITMIDMLIQDLDKEMTSAKTAETEAQAEYEKLMADSAAKRAQDAKTLSEKSATQASLEGDIEAHKDDKLSATKQLMATLEYVQSLHSECDWLIKYFDVRAEARTGEIASLKSAKDVLSGADYSLLQAGSQSFLGRRH